MYIIFVYWDLKCRVLQILEKKTIKILHKNSKYLSILIIAEFKRETERTKKNIIELKR